jgi:signal transduction histidine kinase
VAIVATLVVMVSYLGVAIALDALVAHRLTAQADARLASRLAGVDKPTFPVPGTTPLPTDQDHDVDDAPTFLWAVDRSGIPRALSADAPALPHRAWAVGPTTIELGGTPFRLSAAATPTGWLVAGESLAQLDRVRSALIAPEILFGILLFLVVFVGSLIIGLRASAPAESVRRRQAEFTADASHELRTPLSVIEAEVDLALSRQRSPDEYREVLQRIHLEGQRLHRIVNDLLWLARFDDRGDEHRNGQAADVASLARLGAERFQSVAAARQVSLSWEGDSGSRALVAADPEWIDRLVGVLVDNACKYAGQGGRVVVAVSATGSRIVLRVEDSGPGVPPDQRSMMFDRFHRGVDTVEGSGLGLAIADSVVRATGGSWAVGDSSLGGARFEVSWRRDPRSVAADAPRPEEMTPTG